MPTLSADFLKKYGQALNMTLNEYLALKPDYSDEARAK